MNRSKNRIERIPSRWGIDKAQNCWNGDAPSISAASYMSPSIDCILARMNRNESGKYRQISNTVTMINASGRSPKKLIGVSTAPI